MTSRTVATVLVIKFFSQVINSSYSTNTLREICGIQKNDNHQRVISNVSFKIAKSKNIWVNNYCK